MAHETYDPNSPDFRTQLLRIKSKNPEAIALVAYYADGARAVAILSALNVNAKLFGSSTLNVPEFYRQAARHVEGLILFDVRDVSSDLIHTRWNKKFKEPWPGLQSGVPIFYEYVHALSQAIERVGIKPEQLWKYLVFDSSYRGLSMPFKFNEQGDFAISHTAFIVRGGKPVPLSRKR